MNNEFLKYIKSRGYLHQCTNEIGETNFEKSNIWLYRFDCTSDSLPCRIFITTHASKDLSKTWSQANHY